VPATPGSFPLPSHIPLRYYIALLAWGIERPGGCEPQYRSSNL
jgi:hypothetical protein